MTLAPGCSLQFGSYLSALGRGLREGALLLEFPEVIYA